MTTITEEEETTMNRTLTDEVETTSDGLSTAALPHDDVIPGAGSDASPERRPGVPMQSEPPCPIGFAHWAEPERQRDPGNILRRKGLTELTPVFGTSVAPRGASGMMRRAAYRIPEHYTSHWLILLLADRVDALEHRLGKVLPIAVPLGLAAVGIPLLLRSRARRRRWLPSFR